MFQLTRISDFVGVASYPVGFVQCRRPRHGKGRRLFPAGSAEMARALLKGSGRDERPAAAGARTVEGRTEPDPSSGRK